MGSLTKRGRLLRLARQAGGLRYCTLQQSGSFFPLLGHATLHSSFRQKSHSPQGSQPTSAGLHHSPAWSNPNSPQGPRHTPGLSYRFCAPVSARAPHAWKPRPTDNLRRQTCLARGHRSGWEACSLWSKHRRRHRLSCHQRALARFAKGSPVQVHVPTNLGTSTCSSDRAPGLPAPLTQGRQRKALGNARALQAGTPGLPLHLGNCWVGGAHPSHYEQEPWCDCISQ